MNYQDVITKVGEATNITVVQAENPDGDSLASSLALEELLSEQGKQVSLYCPIDMPRHLRYLSGWDRVQTEWPGGDPDLVIVVDAASPSLLERTLGGQHGPGLAKKPVIILDHHPTENANWPDNWTLVCDVEAGATSEMIFDLAQQAGWIITKPAGEFIATAIMYDTQGLSNESTRPKTIRTIADLVEGGVSLAALDESRRAMMKRSLEVTKYKGQLLERASVTEDGSVVWLHIPWEEIEEYSDKYNPPMLVMDDLRLIEGVKLVVVFKSYPDGRITGKLRANHGWPVAESTATALGGGGHPYAAGFKVRGGNLDDVMETTLKHASDAIAKLESEDQA